MRYEVSALSADHQVKHLYIDAHDERDARRQVEAGGLFVATIAPERGGVLQWSRRGGPRHSRLSPVLFSQELLALLSAGLSIVECLDTLLEKEASSAIRSTLGRLLEGLREGKRFSAVLSEQPETFPPLYIGIVRAAEGTSDLPHSLNRFIDYQQRIDAVRSKIVSAAIYPVILLTVGSAVSLFLICYVVPRFAEVYENAGRELPWLSRMMLHWGVFAANNAATMGAGLAFALVAGAIVLRRFFSRDGAARILVRLPGIGARVRIYELSRLYLTLGMLLEGGIPIVPALKTVTDMASTNIRAGLMRAGQAIEAGTPLSEAFETNLLVTPVSLRLLRVGERSGELGDMLTQSAAFYDGEIGRWIDRFTRMFEPILMAAIGLVVGLIVVLLYMPIFDLAGNFA